MGTLMQNPVSRIPVHLAARLLGFAAIVIPLSACGIAILHPDRTPELYGLAFVRSDPGAAQPPLQQPVVATVWGFGFIRSENGLAVSLGWSRLKQATLINSADAPTASPTGGSVIQIETVGLSYSELPSEAGVTAGYSGAAAVTMAEDALVMGNPVTALSTFSTR
jgi:hypothetical protein